MGEALNLRRKDVDPARGTISVRADKTEVGIANEALLAAEQEPLPDDLTPHSLRRTFASLLFAVGESPVYVMSQLGHSDPSVTLGIHAKVMDRRDGEAER